MRYTLKTMFFVHWASFECKEGLSLIEPRYKIERNRSEL